MDSLELARVVADINAKLAPTPIIIFKVKETLHEVLSKLDNTSREHVRILQVINSLGETLEKISMNIDTLSVVVMFLEEKKSNQEQPKPEKEKAS
ncbi:MAG: hypothetical protein PHT40_01485 [Patescibacteria group bacterium]|nr:hypothetical protein [Patescibacteria group bacterium]